jgi:hypothetical protein
LLLIRGLVFTQTGRKPISYNLKEHEMKNPKMKVIISLFVLISLIPVAGWASGDSDSKRRKGPPPEAFEACEGKQAGDTVEFTGRRGESIKATCEEHDDQLVAVPEGRSKR